jgi:hypothetical protein
MRYHPPARPKGLSAQAVGARSMDDLAATIPRAVLRSSRGPARARLGDRRPARSGPARFEERASPVDILPRRRALQPPFARVRVQLFSAASS